MQDRKALQAGTSHFLGQNFAKSSNIQFLDQTGTKQFAWTTSWGVSTRLVGAMIMTHSDDDGLVIPPKLAPRHVVILPIYKDDSRDAVLAYCQELAKELRKLPYANRTIEVDVDDRDMRAARRRGIMSSAVCRFAWKWVRVTCKPTVSSLRDVINRHATRRR